jgi:hypothetical protein
MKQEQATDVWSAPVFQWRLDSTDLTALYSYAHYVALQPMVVFKDQYNNEQPVLFGPALVLKLDHNRLQLFKEDFNSGLLSNWRASTTGTTAVAELSVAASDTGVLAEDFGDYNLNDWTTVTTGGVVYIDRLALGSNTGAPALKLSRTSNIVGASAYRMFQHQSAPFVVRLSMKTDSSCMNSYAGCQFSQGSTSRIWITYNSGSLKYMDNSGFHTLKSLTVNSWDMIYLRVWPTNGNYSIEVPGKVFVSNAGMMGSAPWDNNWIDTIYFSADARGVNLWADDIWVRSDQALYIYYPDGANTIRLYPTQQIGIDRQRDYSISLDYFVPGATPSSYMDVFDDGKVHLFNAGLDSSYRPVLKAGTGNGDVVICSLNLNAWNRIVVKVHPASNSYYVLVNEYWSDDAGRGPYTLASDSSVNYWFGVGSIDWQVSGMWGQAYWDNIVVAQPYP